MSKLTKNLTKQATKKLPKFDLKDFKTSGWPTPETIFGIVSFILLFELVRLINNGVNGITVLGYALFVYWLGKGSLYYRKTYLQKESDAKNIDVRNRALVRKKVVDAGRGFSG